MRNRNPADYALAQSENSDDVGHERTPPRIKVRRGTNFGVLGRTRGMKLGLSFNPEVAGSKPARVIFVSGCGAWGFESERPPSGRPFVVFGAICTPNGLHFAFDGTPERSIALKRAAVA